jgi:CYTH domain-containing protein
MSSIRRFLVAPALVRLIRKERGSSRITEGHFAPQGGRSSFVRVDGQACQLVLVNGGVEERTDVPRAHGDALLDVCPGKAAYDRTTLAVAGREVAIDRYVTPGSLDLVSVVFDDANQAGAFQVPAWFGKEVTEEAAFDRPALAIQGVPSVGEMLLSNAALDAVLDIIEPRFGFGRFGSPSRSPESGEGLNSPLRRPAAAIQAPETPRPAPTPELEAIAPVAPVALPPPAPEPAPAAVTPVAAEPVHQEESAAEEPVPHEAPRAEEPEQRQPTATGGSPAEAVHGDARIDDVIESLSAALGAAIQQNPAQQAEKQEDPGAVFERWTVRPRRTQNQG